MSSKDLCARLQVEVALCVPALVREAATKAGWPSSAGWLRDLIARQLAEELGESYDEIMGDMPVPWEKRPGAVVLTGNKGSVDVGLDG